MHYGVIWYDPMASPLSYQYMLVRGDGTREPFYEMSSSLGLGNVTSDDEYVSRSLSILAVSSPTDDTMTVYSPDGLITTFERLQSALNGNCGTGTGSGGPTGNPLCAAFVATEIEDLSGNTWTIEYLQTQDYIAHPLVSSVSDGTRTINFEYSARQNGTGQRLMLDEIKLGSKVHTTYDYVGVSLPGNSAPLYHFLSEVSTAEGRTTEFEYESLTSSAPYENMGLITEVGTALGETMDIVWQRTNRNVPRGPDGFPTQVTSKTVDEIRHKSGNSTDFTEDYTYGTPGGGEVETTVAIRRGSSNATKTHTFHDYGSSACTSIELVGMEKRVRLQESSSSYSQVDRTFASPLQVSGDVANPACVGLSADRPQIYRLTSQTTQDTGLAASGAFSQTTTYSNFDFLSPEVEASSPGMRREMSFHNIISNGRYALGLLASVEDKLGSSLIAKTEFRFFSGNRSHQVRYQDMFRTSSAKDTMEMDYFTSGAARGAVRSSKLGNVTTAYEYSKGIVSKVTVGGTTRMQRSSIADSGTFGSEVRDGVTTTVSWDDDWRPTAITAAGQAVRVNYSSGGSNYICIGKGGACSGKSPPSTGGRVVEYDRFGRKIREADKVDGSVTSERTWSDFDYAGRPHAHSDPVAGGMTLDYDVMGRLVSERIGGTTVTQISRNYTSAHQEMTQIKEGVTLVDRDDWAGRPLYRGSKRGSLAQVGMRYCWSYGSGAWKTAMSPGASPGSCGSSTHSEEFDLLGRMLKETRPEIGDVVHSYNERGELTQSHFPGLGYRDCFLLNENGDVTQHVRRTSSTCPSSPVTSSSPQSTIIQAADFHGTNRKPTNVRGRATAFRDAEVLRSYGDWDSSQRPRSLTVTIPRALDAPTVWIGAEAFFTGQNAFSDFLTRQFAFTQVSGVLPQGRYEVEFRVRADSQALLPEYDWGKAQDECDEEGSIGRLPWTGSNLFQGQDLADLVDTMDDGAVNSSFPWNDGPRTLYCWRVRAVKCHDAQCNQEEISPASPWAVFAFNNSVAKPASRDGWLPTPTNTALNIEDESYLTLCGGDACPNVVRLGDANAVSLSMSRTYDHAGKELTVKYPDGDTALQSWAMGGTSLTVGRNALGDVKSVKFALAADGTSRNLYSISSFRTSGSPSSGKITRHGYARPGEPTILSMNTGQVGAAIDSSSSDLTLSWTYDNRGRVKSFSAGPIFSVSNMLYTQDSLLRSWTRSDEGTLGSTTYTAGYDGAGQLTSFNYATGNGVSYVYDARGNLTARNGGISASNLPRAVFSSGAVTTANDGRLELAARSFGTFDNNNRSTAGVVYDGRNREVQVDGVELKYSAKDQLESVSGALGIEQQLMYDAEGNLVRRVMDNEVHYYLYDEGGRLMFEEVHDMWFYGTQFRAADQRVVPHTRRYEYVYADDNHVATIEHADGVSSLSYHIRDWRDFEMVSTDADEGHAPVYRDRSPYGAAMRSPGVGATREARMVNPHQLALGVNNIQVNHWRALMAGRGRFSTPDPALARHVRLPQGLNLYANNLNNPLMYQDRTGELAFLIPVAVLAYRAYSAYSTANDVIDAVKFIANPEITTGDVAAAAVGVVSRALRSASSSKVPLVQRATKFVGKKIGQRRRRREESRQRR